MAIVVERVNNKNNPQPIMDQMQGKEKARPPPPANNSLAAALPKRDPNEDLINQTNQGFFGSFFKNKDQRPGMMGQVPTVLKASGVLSEREQIETEVISNTN
jgi:vacuolar protein sorting-associated protein 1